MADFYDGPLPPKPSDAKPLPDWPDGITSFEELTVTPPGPNEAWAAQHLMMARVATVLIQRDRETLTEQTLAMRDSKDSPGMLDGLIAGLNETREELTSLSCACEWALCRLLIVLGRNVLDDPPD